MIGTYLLAQGARPDHVWAIVLLGAVATWLVWDLRRRTKQIANGGKTR